jgi:CRISPR-associated protein Cas2
MTILILESVPSSLRGELSRWFLEPKAGLFVGCPTSLVRVLLWQRICHNLGPLSGAVLIYSSSNEAGYEIETHGDTRRRIRDVDGLQLVERDHPNIVNALKKLRATPPPGLKRFEILDIDSPWFRRPVDTGEAPT